MNLKRVIKWIGYIVAIIVVLYILIWGVLIYFLVGGDFKNSLIYLSELQESGLYYGNENRKIADNVVAVHEVNNKLYYITLDGIGIFDENVSLLDAWNKDINKYNTFIPRIDAKETQFNVATLIVDATNDMRVAREEIFGPVAVVIKFHSEEEVIEQANDSLYGLGGGVFTQNINRAIRVARGIETGRMWVNTYNSIPAGAPFGGYKQSGIGRETHKVILEHYTQMKNIIVNLSDKPSGFYDLD